MFRDRTQGTVGSHCWSSCTLKKLEDKGREGVMPNHHHCRITISDAQATSVGFWHVQSAKPMHQVTSNCGVATAVQQCTCSFCHGARVLPTTAVVLHAASATHPCLSVGTRLLLTQTITSFVLHGETEKCSRPGTGKVKSG